MEKEVLVVRKLAKKDWLLPRMALSTFWWVARFLSSGRFLIVSANNELLFCPVISDVFLL